MIGPTDEECLSKENALRSIENGEPIIITKCIQLANFLYLEKGYEVIVCRSEASRVNNYVTMSELLENNRDYTEMVITPSDNISKMVATGQIIFLPASDKTKAILKWWKREKEQREMLTAMTNALDVIRNQTPQEYIANVEAMKDGPIANAIKDLKSSGFSLCMENTYADTSKQQLPPT